MGENTKIQWATHSWSPWIGCCKVSDGCKNCYAEAIYKDKERWSNAWGPEVLTQRVITSEQYWQRPITWNNNLQINEPTPLVFPSLCDPFEDHRDIVQARERMFELIENTGNLIWLLLTKRPENINDMVPVSWRMVPPSNAWFGVSVENQKTADERLEHFRFVNSDVKFVSYEPALECVNWDGWEHYLDWMIVGGESGNNARPMSPAWAMIAENWTRKHGVKLFVKQMGSFWAKGKPQAGSKGENIETFPTRLQVREYPRERYT